jgi:hypothetical protein
MTPPSSFAEQRRLIVSVSKILFIVSNFDQSWLAARHRMTRGQGLPYELSRATLPRSLFDLTRAWSEKDE